MHKSWEEGRIMWPGIDSCTRVSRSAEADRIRRPCKFYQAPVIILCFAGAAWFVWAYAGCSSSLCYSATQP